MTTAQFKIDLIVWKQGMHAMNDVVYATFKIDLIVWKRPFPYSLPLHKTRLK